VRPHVRLAGTVRLEEVKVYVIMFAGSFETWLWPLVVRSVLLVCHALAWAAESLGDVAIQRHCARSRNHRARGVDRDL
jgi:hypothetical protein